MTRLTTLTGAALAVAALAPAAGTAADAPALRGAPQMRVVDAGTVTVAFATSARITAKHPRVVVSDRGTAHKHAIKADGRHGRDFRYVATVRLRRAMTVGRKYTVRFAIAGERSVERLVVLKARR